MSKIIAIQRDEWGNISSYKTDDGQILNKMQAVHAADKGQLEGVASFTTRNGGVSIRSNRGQKDYSLDSLPEFK